MLWRASCTLPPRTTNPPSRIATTHPSPAPMSQVQLSKKELERRGIDPSTGRPYPSRLRQAAENGKKGAPTAKGSAKAPASKAPPPPAPESSSEEESSGSEGDTSPATSPRPAETSAGAAAAIERLAVNHEVGTLKSDVIPPSREQQRSTFVLATYTTLDGLAKNGGQKEIDAKFATQIFQPSLGQSLASLSGPAGQAAPALTVPRIVTAIEVAQMRNDAPFTVAVGWVGKPFLNTIAAAPGQNCFCTIPGETNIVFPQPKVLYDGQALINSEIVQQAGSITALNVLEDDLKWPVDGTETFVRRGTPIYALIERNRPDLKLPSLPADEDDMVCIAKDVVKEAFRNFNERVLGALPRVDLLTECKFDVSRVGDKAHKLDALEGTKYGLETDAEVKATLKAKPTEVSLELIISTWTPPQRARVQRKAPRQYVSPKDLTGVLVPAGGDA